MWAADCSAFGALPKSASFCADRVNYVRTSRSTGAAVSTETDEDFWPRSARRSQSETRFPWSRQIGFGPRGSLTDDYDHDDVRSEDDGRTELDGFIENSHNDGNDPMELDRDDHGRLEVEDALGGNDEDDEVEVEVEEVDDDLGGNGHDLLEVEDASGGHCHDGDDKAVNAVEGSGHEHAEAAVHPEEPVESPTEVVTDDDVPDS